MVSHASLSLTLALLLSTAGASPKNNGIDVTKCCGEYEMLSANGSCVEAPWPRNTSFQRDRYNFILPPLDRDWVHRWLPPGFPVENISYVLTRMTTTESTLSPVKTSSLWEPALLESEDVWRRTVAFLGRFFIARPRPGGGLRRKASYCVDAAQPPLGPFAMFSQTICSEEECAFKCCDNGHLLKSKDALWECDVDVEGVWAPKNSSLGVDPEFPSATFKFSQDLHLSSLEVGDVRWALRDYGVRELHFSTWETCFDFYRAGDGSVQEGLFYVAVPRVTRGVFWLLRPLCALSALLLLAALISIACDKSMRRKIHGRCLASYAACLFAFNAGHFGYYIAVSGRVHGRKENLPPDLQIVCKCMAFWMYFLLTAAWCWLTALCVNMAKGFSLQVARQRKESRKRFLAISSVAWGVPVLLTIACFFLIVHEIENTDDVRWYNPSLAESRVCYGEYLVTWRVQKDISGIKKSYFLKSGTAVFYFGPIACLAMCNVICLSWTLRKVQYLKRGNSVLRREEDKVPLGQRQPEGNNPRSAHAATGQANRNRSASNVDAKTIKLYMKMILTTGVIELFIEIIMWSATTFEYDWYTEEDLSMAYRAAGYVTDFFRAAVVTWLAAPEGGYLGLVRRLRRGKGEKKKNVA